MVLVLILSILVRGFVVYYLANNYCAVDFWDENRLGLPIYTS
jgi:hypothetical protein